MIHAMAGAVATGIAALVWGTPGLLVGLILACAYYGRTLKR